MSPDSFFLPLMRQQQNYHSNTNTRTGCWRTKTKTTKTKTVLHLNLRYLFFPLWWDNDRTTTQTPTPGLDAEGLTPKLLRQKPYCIWTWESFFFFLFSLCLSNACLAHCWLVHYLSLFISLAWFCFLLVCFYFCFFPSSLPSLLSFCFHPSTLDIIIVTITR
jgi:hypothetical protein